METERKRFNALVTDVFDDLYRFAVRLERDPVAAEDLLQQALITAFSRIGQLNDEGAFRVWQSRILLRTHQNRRRKRTEQAMSPETLDHVQSNVVELPANPHRSLERARLAETLADAIDELPDGQRAVILLVDVEGFAMAEAAEILDVPWGTIASRVARGRRTLRVSLDGVAREQGVIQ